MPGPFNCRQPAAPLSLSYLHRFPFDEIKIDRSCINDIGQSETSSPIVQAVVLHQ
nr:EAL domain-containing protein [Bradyrhizobium guangxiense]